MYTILRLPFVFFTLLRAVSAEKPKRSASVHVQACCKEAGRAAARHLAAGRPLARKLPIGHGEARAGEAGEASQHHHAEHPGCAAPEPERQLLLSAPAEAISDALRGACLHHLSLT